MSEQVLTHVIVTLSHVSDVAFFPYFHGDCVRGDFLQFQWQRIDVIVQVEVQHIGVNMLRSALLFLCGKAKKKISSRRWLGFRSVTKQRGIPAGCPGMWGLWVRWGGAAHTNKVLDFRPQRLSHSNTKVLLIKSASS